jgi:ATP-binding cassette, subfamily B, bacterial MsbA
MRHRHSSPTSSESQDKLVRLTWPAVRRLLGLAAPHKRILILAGVLMLMGTGISLSFPLILRQAANDVVGTQNVAHLDRYVLWFVGLISLSAILGFTQFLLTSYAGNRIVMDLRLSLFDHLQRLPVAFFDRTRSGDLASHLSNDVSQLQSTLTDDIAKVAANLLTLFGGIVIVLNIDWRLTSIVLGVLFVTMMFFVVSGRRLRKLNRSALDALGDAMGSITEALSNIRLVKAFAREQHEHAKAREKLRKVFGLNMKSARAEGMMGAVAAAGFSLVLLGVLWYGGRRVIDGSLMIGDLLAFFLTITIISGPMSSLASLYTRLQRAVGASDRLFDILDDPLELADAPDALAFPVGEGEVTFEDVRFAYVNDVPVLQGLSLEMPAGSVTALVGPSGSGKTTVASLLYRFYEPSSGEIRIDGVRIGDIERRQLRDHIGIVPQEPILFNGTILENIRYGRLEATDAEVIEAAKDANVDEFVRVLPAGYDTVLGERGITLSGGQRQRVAIARALLKNPKILILDEATSALDNKSESLVKEALDRLMRGRTTLVIAHRLSTVQKADQIAVLAEGRLAELGTHRQLMESNGRYAELYELAGQAS